MCKNVLLLSYSNLLSHKHRIKCGLLYLLSKSSFLLGAIWKLDIAVQLATEHRSKGQQRDKTCGGIIRKPLIVSVVSSVTRLGDFLHFGQLFNAFGNN